MSRNWSLFHYFLFTTPTCSPDHRGYLSIFPIGDWHCQRQIHQSSFTTQNAVSIEVMQPYWEGLCWPFPRHVYLPLFKAVAIGLRCYGITALWPKLSSFENFVCFSDKFQIKTFAPCRATTSLSFSLSSTFNRALLFIIHLSLHHHLILRLCPSYHITCRLLEVQLLERKCRVSNTLETKSTGEHLLTLMHSSYEEF